MRQSCAFWGWDNASAKRIDTAVNTAFDGTTRVKKVCASKLLDIEVSNWPKCRA